MARRAIAVFGSSSPRPGELAYVFAHDLGIALGAAGFDVINGGHDGTMAAVSDGARFAGAFVLGVTCESIRSARNTSVSPSIHAYIDAPSLLVRIEIMMRRASGYVFLPGGSGTLAELGVIWEHVAKGLITHRPLVFIQDAWSQLVDEIERDSAQQYLHRVYTVDNAVATFAEHTVELPDAERNFTAGKEIVRVNE